MTADIDRAWNTERFESAFRRVIAEGEFLEERDYYPRYKSRYRETLKYVPALQLPSPCQVIDIGGGHLALLMHEIWGDQPIVLDINDKYHDYLESIGVRHEVYDLVYDEPLPLQADLVILAEVIEHLPVPPCIVLEKVGRMLSEGGWLLLTTPNGHRLRNLVRMIQGRDYLTRFRYPPRGQPMGHVLEYTAEHLRWQVEEAGFEIQRLDFRHFRHVPNAISDRLLYWLGRPLYARPSWRDQLVVIARKRTGASSQPRG